MGEMKNRLRKFWNVKRAFTSHPEPDDPKTGNHVNYGSDYKEQSTFQSSAIAGAQDDRLQAQLNFSPSDLSHLRGLISAAMRDLKPPKIGLDSSQRYLPDSKLKALMKEENVKKTTEDPALLRFIVNDAPKTFAITLLAIEDSSNLLKAMEAFKRHGFTDRLLPIKDLSEAVECSAWDTDRTSVCGPKCAAEDGRICRGMHDAALDVFHHTCWNATSFKHFYDDQWSFLVQKFELEKFEYNNIDAKIVLPFIPTVAKKGEKTEKRGKAGHFSEVSHAKMLTEYHDSYDSKIDYADVAIKTLKPVNDPGYDMEEEWRHESEALKELNDLEHDHIVRGLASFKHGRHYHLLLEWAAGGSLQSFWEEYPEPEMNAATIKALLNQLIGLTDALYAMHSTAVAVRSRRPSSTRHYSRPHSRRSSMSARTSVQDFAVRPNRSDSEYLAESRETQNTPANGVPAMNLPTFAVDPADVQSSPDIAIEAESIGLVAEVSDDEDNWRHGDIKPGNILRFVDTSESRSIGQLKLADLGRAKKNKDNTKQRVVVDVDIWRSKPYEPPDTFISQGKRSTSRLYDIWSLGCVFFEGVVWMLYGSKCHQSFTETTAKSETEGSPYWKRHGKGALLSDMASVWMAHILTKDPECTRETGELGTVMGDLLKLIKDKLLVVALPQNSKRYTPGFRTNAEDLRKDLKAIAQRANDNEKYAFRGLDRSKVEPPPLVGIASRSTPSLLARSAALQISSLNAARGQRALTSRSQGQYKHAIHDVWSYEDDQTFIDTVIRQNMEQYTELSQVDAKLCSDCSKIDFDVLGKVASLPKRSMTDLRKMRSQCVLCAMVYFAADKATPKLDRNIPFGLDRVPMGLTLNGQPDCILRVSRSFTMDPSMSTPNTRIGLPRLSDCGSNVHFDMMRAWLFDCDNHHGCSKSISNAQNYVPKRLLWVGDSAEATSSKVVETEHLSDAERMALVYVALSHPWGVPSNTNRHFCSTPDTIEDYLEELMDDELPATFKDALRVTRELNKAYLWIDSICVIQGPEGDFKDEAEHMQDIFSSAYCVIAASSATGMDSGLLKLRAPRIPAAIPSGKSKDTKDQLYVSEILDDFKQDVIDSPLSQRGWVLQERALARRSIYFSNNQTYWECSDGIRCETGGKLNNNAAAFLGSSDFPNYAGGQNIGAQLYLFTQLYEQYSRLSFSHLSDKPVALSGLEQRLTQVFDDRSGAGVFEKRRGRFLLWQRNELEVKGLTRINFDPTIAEDGTVIFQPKPESKRTPSWSWMSYEEGIVFERPEGGTVEWDKTMRLNLTGNAQTSWLYTDNISSFEAQARDYNLGSDALGETRLVEDNPEDLKGRATKCVIIGRWKKVEKPRDARHYVILVSLKNTGNAYERVGAGYLPGRYIMDLDDNSVKYVNIE